MFTNEFEYDSTITTILDSSAKWPDVELIIDDAGVYIRQYSEKKNSYDLIVMTPRMFHELMIAMKTTSGAFEVILEKNYK